MECVGCWTHMVWRYVFWCYGSSTLLIAYTNSLEIYRPIPAAYKTSHGFWLIIKAPITTSTDNTFEICFTVNKYWHFMLIACQAGGSHEVLRLIFYEKWIRKKNKWIECLLQILFDALRANFFVCLFFFSFLFCFLSFHAKINKSHVTINS